MCIVIVTGRGLVLFLVNLAAVMCIVYSVLTPKWLIGPTKSKVTSIGVESYVPTVGIYNRCTRIDHKELCGPFSQEGLATDNNIFPPAWKTTYFFMLFGLSVLCLSMIGVLMSCCYRSVCGKSLYSLAGVLQAFAGIFLLIGLLVYPWGWSAPRVRTLCGEGAAIFYMADCTLGWAAGIGVIGTGLSFVGALLTPWAEGAISSRRVQRHLDTGNGLICLP